MTPPDYDLKEINTREEELGVDGPKVKSVVPLTQVDESDMYRLGKQQDLNVCTEGGGPSIYPANQLIRPSATSVSFPSWVLLLFLWVPGKVNLGRLVGLPGCLAAWPFTPPDRRVE